MKRDPKFNVGDLLRSFGEAIIGRVEKVEWSGSHGAPSYLLTREVNLPCTHEPANSYCNCSHKRLYVSEREDLFLVDCGNCGSEDIGGECSSLDKGYFCCEECLDSYLEGGQGILSPSPQDTYNPDHYSSSRYTHDGKAFRVRNAKEEASV